MHPARLLHIYYMAVPVEKVADPWRRVCSNRSQFSYFAIIGIWAKKKCKHISICNTEIRFGLAAYVFESEVCIQIQVILKKLGKP